MNKLIHILYIDDNPLDRELVADALTREHGAFRLVRESLLERNRLLQNAPHAVVPIAFTIPIYKRFSGILNAPLKFLGLLDKPTERGALVIKLDTLFHQVQSRYQYFLTIIH